MILHQISKRFSDPSLVLTHWEHAEQGSCILFVDDGCYNCLHEKWIALHKQGINLYTLESAVSARGLTAYLTPEPITLLSEQAYYKLLLDSSSLINW